jgi:glucokinase
MEHFAIGVDLGGTTVRAALVDDRGNILAQNEDETDATGGPERVLSQILGLSRQLTASRPGLAPAGVGVSTPGPVDTISGIASDIPTLSGFAGFPLRAELERQFGLSVSLENDGIAAAIGEWQFGAGKGHDSLVYVTVSTGIGGGIIADGRVVRGRMGMAGHVGHMTITPDGEPCPCGNRGCFEAYASGTAFTRRARQRASGRTDTLLGRDGSPINSRAIFEAGRKGDTFANQVIDEEADTLGRGITNLLHVLSPEIVVMGGGLSNEFDRLHAGIADHITRRAMPAFREVPVVRAALGQNSGLVGAAALALPGRNLAVHPVAKPGVLEF